MPKSGLVIVTWYDSATMDEWQGREDATRRGAQLAKVKTVGFLLKITRRAVVVAGSWSDADMVSETFSIPRKCVKRIRRVRVAK
jgi:hypothetical protein